MATYKVTARSGLRVRSKPNGTIMTAMPYGTTVSGRWEKARRMVPRKIQRKMGLVLWPIPGKRSQRKRRPVASIAAKKKPAKKPKTKKANSKKKTDTKKKTDDQRTVQKQKEHSAAGAQI